MMKRRLVFALLLLLVIAVTVTTVFADEVTWTGNGTTDGFCNKFEDDPEFNPAPGQQAWHFILTQAVGSDPTTHTLYYSFSDGTNGSVQAYKVSGGAAHFVVYTAINAQLLSASAVNGTTESKPESNLNVSHCEKNDPPTKLIVCKLVVNNNGGTQAADFPITVTNTNPSPASFSLADQECKEVTLVAGEYSVSETVPFGYDVSYSVDCSGSIATGETKYCTVTNDDIQPKLIVCKEVINNNGGTQTTGFQIDVTGVNAAPASFLLDKDACQEVALDAGEYSVVETAPFGYTASYSEDCDGAIAIGETKYCTVTNDDIQPKLTVCKVVVNDDGGKKTTDFAINVSGTNVSPAALLLDDQECQDVTLNAGNYSVTETAPSGYTASYSAYCTGTIGIGQTKTCTVTNNDKPLWCSPGFWGSAAKFNVSSYVAGNGSLPTFSLTNTYSTIQTNAPQFYVPLKKGDPTKVTLGQVLASPSTYGGPAFNAVANYIAYLLGWNGTQATGDNCPLNASGKWIGP